MIDAFVAADPMLGMSGAPSPSAGTFDLDNPDSSVPIRSPLILNNAEAAIDDLHHDLVIRRT